MLLRLLLEVRKVNRTITVKGKQAALPFCKAMVGSGLSHDSMISLARAYEDSFVDIGSLLKQLRSR